MKSKKRKDGSARLRVKSVDRVECVGPGTYKVEATMVEDDQPARKGRGTHRVTEHRMVRQGRNTWVSEHEARNPRR
jgi:hypothetical protein